MNTATYQGLSFVTRGGASPKGRPRIYFCCHPADFQTYFGPIVRAILEEKSDVAVWYYDPAAGVPSGEEYLTDLRQMQLFVFPVTRHFLDESSSAKDVELALALQEHIPILPLVIEAGLESEFDQKIGNVHALSFPLAEGGKMPPAVGRLLRSIFPESMQEEGLSDNVFGSFDAYLFLSYRKQDRVIAEKLIKMIRAKQPLDHTAIWFDEFIVPGEDYNEDIAAAIRGCSVFLLLATEHLNESSNYVIDKENEPHNYVIDQEIPAATQIGKPVCVVLAGIDKEALPKSLASAHICSLEDEESIRQTLKVILSAISRADADLPPERRRVSPRLSETLLGRKVLSDETDMLAYYYEGLACMRGILSETDPNRAFRMMQLSAQMGLPEAMRQVASMYSLGQGTEREIAGSLIWQEQYLNTIEDEEDRLFQYYLGLEDLIRYQSAAILEGKCSEEDKATRLHELLNKAEELETRGLAPRNTATVEAKLILEEHCRQMGDDTAADAWFREAEAALREAGVEENEFSGLLSAEFNAISGEKLLEENNKKGLALMQNALETLKEIENPLVVPLRFSLAVEISQALMARGKLVESREIMRSALQDAHEIEANEGAAVDPELLYPLYLRYGIFHGPAPSEEAKTALLAARDLLEKTPSLAQDVDKKAFLYNMMGQQEAFSKEERIAFLRQGIFYAENLDFAMRVMAQGSAKRTIKKLEKELKHPEGGKLKGLFKR